MYFTPYNTVEIWDIAAFQRLRRAWFFTADTSAHRQFVHRDSIPVSDIPTDYVAGENEEFRLVSVPGLAYAIPMLWPDSAQYYADSTAQATGGGGGGAAPEADDCGWGWKRFKGRIDHVRLFTMHRQDGSSPAVYVPIGMKGIEVEIRFRHRNWTQHLLTVYTDDEGYLTRNGSRVFDFDECATIGRSSIPIYLKVKFRDQSNRIIVWEDNGRDLIVYRTGDYHLPYTSSGHTLVWNGNNQIELPDYLGGKAFTWARWAKTRTNDALAGTGAQLSGHHLHLRLERNQNSQGGRYDRGDKDIYLGPNDLNSEFVVMHEFGHYVMHALWNFLGNNAWRRSSKVCKS